MSEKVSAVVRMDLIHVYSSDSADTVETVEKGGNDNTLAIALGLAIGLCCIFLLLLLLLCRRRRNKRKDNPNESRLPIALSRRQSYALESGTAGLPRSMSTR